MHQAFYQSKPKQDTPYRQLDLTCDRTKGWVVRLFGGTKWVAKGDKDPEPTYPLRKDELIRATNYPPSFPGSMIMPCCEPSTAAT